MIRVLLVEDEPFILQGLKVLIDWNREGFEVVKAAENGREAYEYLLDHEVDLILSDIRMPEMDGLSLLEAIRTQGISDAYFAVLSGYNDFSYAQKAMSFDCMSYLLKPVEKDSLLELLHKVSSALAKDDQEVANRRELERVYLEKSILAVIGGKHTEEQLQYVKNHLQLSEGVRYISLEFDEAVEELEELSARKHLHQMHTICCELLKGDAAHAVSAVSREEHTYDEGLIFCDYMAANQGCSEEEFFVRMQKHIEAESGRKVIMLVGKRVDQIGALSKSYASACILKSIIGFREKKNVYIYEKEAQVGKTGLAIRQLLCKDSLDRLIRLIEQHESEQIPPAVENLYQEFRRTGGGRKAVDLNINYLLFQLIHLASQQDDEVDQEEVLRKISESTFGDGVSRGSIYHLTNFCCTFSDYLMQLRKNASRGVLAEIEKEIRTHYNENISLSSLSKKYYMNSSYLGQMFHKQYGRTFKDYLTAFRIETAAGLLLSTDKRITVIAEEVGYKDSNYFIQKFIEQKGCTPSRYRKNR
ncbi:MAG: response regulator [Lachnospiraceae bacterium]|nr:response regulator [Lachnospiraceae bacterium]